MHFGYAGSPAFAADILQILLDANFTPQVVFTQPPKPTGRGLRVQQNPVFTLAQQEALRVETPKKIIEHSHLLSQLELLVVAAYGQILPPSILNAPSYGCINVHSSLLPRWRGASPIEHAILHGDNETGVSVMHIEPQLDAGPVYLQQSLPLTGRETSASLTKGLAQIGGNSLLRVLKQFSEEDIPKPIPQAKSGISYAPRLSTEDARLDWTLSATQNERKVRAFVGRTSAFTTRGDLRLKVIAAEIKRGNFAPGRLYRSTNELIIGCSQDGLLIQSVQLNRGKGAQLTTQAALNGYGRLLADGIQFE